jgi:hypothetical protein
MTALANLAAAISTESARSNGGCLRRISLARRLIRIPRYVETNCVWPDRELNAAQMAGRLVPSIAANNQTCALKRDLR